MFRKLIHIIVALLLLTSTAGFTVSKHFCENRLVSVSMGSSSHSCNNEDRSDCCRDLTAHFQVKEDFNFKKISFIPEIPAIEDSVFTVFNNAYTEDKLNKAFTNVVKIVLGKGQPSLSILQRYLL
jgi:hypothetical protein